MYTGVPLALTCAKAVIWPVMEQVEYLSPHDLCEERMTWMDWYQALSRDLFKYSMKGLWNDRGPWWHGLSVEVEECQISSHEVIPLDRHFLSMMTQLSGYPLHIYIYKYIYNQRLIYTYTKRIYNHIRNNNILYMHTN